MLWREAEDQVTLSAALDCLFARTPYRGLAEEVFNWFKEQIPYRCGVRLGKERITFLVGNYRPAAIKRHRGMLRVDMGFVGQLPDSFALASDVWGSIDDVKEGYLIVNRMPLPLSSADIGNFVLACERMREAAPKTRMWDCNVAVDWADSKPFPYARRWHRKAGRQADLGG